MNQEGLKIYSDVLETLFISIREEKQCEDIEVIEELLKIGAGMLRTLAPGLEIQTYMYRTVPLFRLTVTTQETEWSEDLPVEEQVGDPIGPTIPEGGSDADVTQTTQVIRSVRMK